MKTLISSILLIIVSIVPLGGIWLSRSIAASGGENFVIASSCMILMAVFILLTYDVEKKIK